MRALRILTSIVALVVLCSRTSTAQYGGDPTSPVRTQGIDPQSNAPSGYTPGMHSDMQFQGPAQPMPVSRPVNWPGTPVDSSTGAAPQYNQPAAAPYSAPATAPTGATARPGVKVWGPSLGGQSQAAPVDSPAYPAAPAAAPPPNNSASPGFAPLPAPAMPPTAAAQQTATAPAAGPPNYPQMASVAPLPQYPTTGYAAEPLGNAAAAPPQAAPSVSADPMTSAPNMTILPSEPKDYPDAQVAGRIGSEVVLVGDLKAMVGDMLAQRKVQIPPDQKDAFYEQGCRQVLKQVIETKLVFNDAMHTVPAAGLATMETKVNDYFDKDQLPELFKTYGAATRQELDAKLREHGSSLDRVRKQFFERTVAKEWLRQQVKMDEEVPHSDVLGYYQQHIADYEFPAKVKWEELMVRFDRYPNKEAAYAAIAEMGNQAMRGTAFVDVAKQQSQGPTASNGGAYDWTVKGSLVSKTIDESLFTLPPGKFSQIVEDDRGFHILRVLERKDAGRTSFVDAQGDIKKNLKDQTAKKQINTYLDELRKKTPITTMYDNLPGGLEGKTAGN